MAKAKVRPTETPSAWTWLCGWVRRYGLDLNTVSLAEAATSLIEQLESYERSDQACPPDLVRLAALLVRIQGEMLSLEAEAPQPFVERAYARERARSLARQLDLGPLLRPKPVIGEPEPTPEPDEPVRLYDLVQEVRLLVERAQKPVRNPSQSH